MRAIEIEDWALRVINQVECGTPIEDSRVELKGPWPRDPNKAARRIAGHCNAAAGDLVLWLIGVDQDTGVVGVDYLDMATWWPRVSSEFDGQVPYFQDLCLSLSGVTVVALLFETDRAPFVVRNAAYGLSGGGPVAREVPWREGTSVRSANRSDLLRLLIPTSKLPVFEFYQAEAYLWQEREGYRLSVQLTVYAVVSLGAALVLPDHQAQGKFRLAEPDLGGALKVNLVAGSQSLPFWSGHSNDLRTHMVNQGDRQVILEGPGFLQFFGEFFPLSINFAVDKLCPLEVAFSARPAGGDLSAAVQKILLPRTDRPSELDSRVAARWC